MFEYTIQHQVKKQGLIEEKGNLTAGDFWDANKALKEFVKTKKLNVKYCKIKEI